MGPDNRVPIQLNPERLQKCVKRVLDPRLVSVLAQKDHSSSYSDVLLKGPGFSLSQSLLRTSNEDHAGSFNLLVLEARFIDQALVSLFGYSNAFFEVLNGVAELFFELVKNNLLNSQSFPGTLYYYNESET